MVAAGWIPTVDSYLGRATKAQILEAVREAKGEQAAKRLETLKKGEMAVEAERLLQGSGWLPEPLRTRGVRPAMAELGEHAEPIEPVSESVAKIPPVTLASENDAKDDSDPQAIVAE